MDLVVTVDSSVGHLAGAMGKEVWVALSRPHDDRWGDGETTPLYPSMRLFRQRKAGDWKGVMEEIAEAVKARIEGEPVPHGPTVVIPVGDSSSLPCGTAKMAGVPPC
jgi:hypothetical protein